MNILDFFDVNDIEHIRAYRNLQNTGMWPKGFIPEGTTFPPYAWQSSVASMLADAWVSLALDVPGPHTDPLSRVNDG